MTKPLALDAQRKASNLDLGPREGFLEEVTVGVGSKRYIRAVSGFLFLLSLFSASHCSQSALGKGLVVESDLHLSYISTLHSKF